MFLEKSATLPPKKRRTKATKNGFEMIQICLATIVRLASNQGATSRLRARSIGAEVRHSHVNMVAAAWMTMMTTISCLSHLRVSVLCRLLYVMALLLLAVETALTVLCIFGCDERQKVFCLTWQHSSPFTWSRMWCDLKDWRAESQIAWQFRKKCMNLQIDQVHLYQPNWGSRGKKQASRLVEMFGRCRLCLFALSCGCVAVIAFFE